MPVYELRSVGLGVAVEVDGAVELFPGSGTPTFVLLAEDHLYPAGVACQLRNACNLHDSGCIGRVGVEEFEPGDIKPRITEELRRRRQGDSIAEYAASLKKDLGGDQGIISAIASKPRGDRWSFARYLLYLRPEVEVVGVEDPVLKAQAQAASEEVAKEFADEPDPAVRKRKQIEKFRRTGTEREHQRDLAFVRHAMDGYRDSRPGIIINGGGQHIQRLAHHLQQQRHSYVLIVPPGYRDTLAE